jgi:CRISPR-associated protein Cmr1
METIEAVYRIVTPMFIGGADQKPNDGVRAPSFKGMLRFWWRALNWGRC